MSMVSLVVNAVAVFVDGGFLVGVCDGNDVIRRLPASMVVEEGR